MRASLKWHAFSDSYSFAIITIIIWLLWKDLSHEGAKRLGALWYIKLIQSQMEALDWDVYLCKLEITCMFSPAHKVS